MLEFIVLGQIPGTHFVLTFSWVVALATVSTGTLLIRREHIRRELMQQVEIEEVAI